MLRAVAALLPPEASRMFQSIFQQVHFLLTFSFPFLFMMYAPYAQLGLYSLFLEDGFVILDLIFRFVM